MKCPKCNSDNPDTQQFCGECGTKLVFAKDIPATSTKSLVTPRAELTTGSIFAGRYKIIEELGKGGMGKVYKVIDKQLNEEVALKLIKPEIASDKKTIKRFRNELKLSRKISHRNVGRMYELMEDKGALFITMEYVPGQDLKGLIRQSGRLAIGTTISIAKQVCEGLAEAHRLGVIHRDLKPNNIMIDKGGNARIMDFGIARSLTEKSMTRAGAMIGTPEYMSPEQAEAEEVDQRSDIYSLGVILYEMLTGQLPFEGQTPLSIAMKHKGEIPTDPKELNPQIPGDLSQVILKCLEKDKENRYQDAEELRLELDNIEMGIPTLERVVLRKKTLTSKEITVTLSLRKFFIPALIIVALVIAGVSIRRFFPPKVPGDIPSIAVLPFEDFSPKKDQEYFCEGLKESIIHALKQARNLRVPATTSPFKGKERDYREIGRKLKVRTVLDGSVQKVEDKIRIIAKLIDIADESIIWTDQFDPEQEDIFSILDKISMTIVEKLKVNLLGGEKTKIVKRYTENPEAWDLYSWGRHFWNKETEEGFKKAIEYFQEAIDADPNYALAYTGLADVCSDMASWSLLPADEAMPRASEAAKRALEIDDTLAEAHVSMAFVKIILDWDWAEAERELKRALELNPKYGFAHHLYAHLNLLLGQENEALMKFEQALQIDPLSPHHMTCFADFYIHVGRYDQAEEWCLKALEIEPDSAPGRYFLGWTYVRKGMLDEAIEEFQKAPSVCEVPLAHAYAISGSRTDALRILNEILARSRQSFVDPRNVAVIYVGLGETDQALDWLEEAYEKRNSGWLPFIGVEPDFLSLHGHPRFEALLKKMGVSPTFDELRSDRRFDDLLRRIGFEPKPKSQSTAERQVVKQTNGKIMLAVLPFENMSRDPQEWFSDGMTNEMIDYWTYFKGFQ